MDQSTLGAVPGSAGYPEWAAAFQQAYYTQGAQPPQGYFNPASPSPQHHYMWPTQHMMPPYATPPPPPYGAMYPPGAMYGHPTMSTAQQPYMNYGMPSPSAELAGQTGAAGGQEDLKSPAEPLKDNNKSKKLKNSTTAKLPAASMAHANKLSSPAGNGGVSPSGDDDEEDDDDEDEEGDEEGQMQVLQMEAIGGQRQGTSGMMSGDYWQQQNPRGGGVGKQRGGPPLGGQPGVSTEPWLQDEREVKRQRRKQSNRESARRSRLRKQAECEELGTRVDALLHENASLRGELKRFNEERRRLQMENDGLQEQLNAAFGSDGSSLHATQADTDGREMYSEVHDGIPVDSNQIERLVVKQNENNNGNDGILTVDSQKVTILSQNNSYTHTTIQKEDENGSGAGAPNTVAAG